jgi:hypothetical protein
LDDVSDANLGFNYVAPQVAHGLPPIGRYLTTFKNQLFISGVSTDVNNVFYSGLNSPEYFPPGGNAFLVDAFQGSKVRGLGSLHTAVIVFKDVSIQAVTGDIGADNFAVNEISYGGIGCMAHASIQKLNGALYFLSRTGIYTVDITNGVVPKGKKIQSEFTKASVAFNLQKAVAGSWLRENKYLLFMPVEGTDGSGHKYADKTTSYVYVHDYKWDAWHKWTNINAQGGFAYSDTMNLMYFTSRRLDTQSLTTTFESAIFNTYGNRNDYSDHNEAINWSYAINWIDLGDPAVYKKFLRCRFFTLPSDVLSGDASLYSMTVQQEIDFATPAPIAIWDVDFTGGANGYDTAGWGATPWGDSLLPGLKSKLKGSKCRTMRLVFLNDNIGQNVLISGFEIEAVLPYSVHIKE